MEGSFSRPMRLFRRIFLIGLLLLVGVGVWAAIYAQSRGFTRSWRRMVEAEFANRGVYVDIDKLTLGPFQGLVAEGVCRALVSLWARWLRMQVCM